MVLYNIIHIGTYSLNLLYLYILLCVKRNIPSVGIELFLIHS